MSGNVDTVSIDGAIGFFNYVARSSSRIRREQPTPSATNRAASLCETLDSVTFAFPLRQ